MKLKSLILSLLATGMLSTSCLKEDHSDCYNIYRLALSYMGDGQTEIFNEKISQVEMYVFDGQNNAVYSKQLSESEVRARLTELPHLDAGTYRIVCIGNTFSTETENLNSSDYSEMRFASSEYMDGETVSGNDPLYLASMDYVIEPYDEKKLIETKTISFASSHYDITVDVEGTPFLESPDGTGKPTIELAGVLPYTDFTNIAEGSPTTYVLDTVSDGYYSLSSAANIMRHQNHSDVNLVVKDALGNVAATINFAEHIAKYKIDTSLHECVIPFKVVFAFEGITITVPSWYLVEVKPEF